MSMKIAVSLKITDEKGGAMCEESRMRTIVQSSDIAAAEMLAVTLADLEKLLEEARAAFDVQAAKWMDVMHRLDTQQ